MAHKSDSGESNKKTPPRLNDKQEKFLLKARDRFKQSQDANSDNRDNYEENIKFLIDENHWPDEVRELRESNRQPCMSVNMMPTYVHQVTNDFKQDRPGIKIKPADNYADVDTAEIFQGLIRNIEAVSHADDAYDSAFTKAVTGNVGYFRVVTQFIDDSFEQEIRILPIVNSLSVYGDPLSRAPDGSDADWWFVEDVISKKEFEREWPDVELRDWVQGENENDWLSDDDIRICEYYQFIYKKDTLHLYESKKEGEEDTIFYESERDELETPLSGEPTQSREVVRKTIKWSKISGGQVLEGYDGSDESLGDWAGSLMPIMPIYGDMVDDNGELKLYCLFSWAKDSQRMYSWFRSTEVELNALQTKAPWVGAEGQFEGHEDEWQDANNVAQSYLEYKPITYADGSKVPAPQRQAFQGAPQGVMAGAMNAEKDIMGTTGLHEAGLGQKSNETSGKAILARQKEGDTSTYHFKDNASKSIRRLGEVLIDLIPKIYDTPRVVRVLGEDGSDKMVEINQPVKETNKQGEEIEKIYNLNVGRYDVIASAGANYASQREEMREGMFQVMQGNPALWGQIGDLVIEAFDVPGADKIADRMRKFLPPNIQEPKEGEEAGPPPELMEAQQQMEEMDGAIQQLQGELESKQGEEQIAAEKLRIDMFKAETDRVKAEGEVESGGLTEQEKIQFDGELKLKLQENEIDSKERIAMFNADKEGFNLEAENEKNESFNNLEQHVIGLTEHSSQLANELQMANNKANQKKQVVRDADGEIIAIAYEGGEMRAVLRDENGDIVGEGEVITPEGEL